MLNFNDIQFYQTCIDLNLLSSLIIPLPSSEPGRFSPVFLLLLLLFLLCFYENLISSFYILFLSP